METSGKMPWYVKLFIIFILFGIFKDKPGLAISLSIIFLLITPLFSGKKQSTKGSSRAPSGHIHNFLTRLVVLNIELKKQYQAGKIEQARYFYLTDKIDDLIRKRCQDLGENERIVLLEEAWELLEKSTYGDIGVAPWKKQDEIVIQVPETPESEAVKEPESLKPEAAKAPESQATVVKSPPPVQSQEIKLPPPFTFEVSESVKEKESEPVPKPLPESRPSPEKKSLKIEKPIVKKPKFDVMAFVAKVIFPFLWQNIGWFIGGFCIVSGLTFLIVYSTGFAKGIAVLATLCVYAGILFFGGYQLRKKRPELITSSNVLLTLGMLLIPLTFAVATRLIVNSEGVLLLSLTVGLSAVVFIAFSWVSNLASSLIERQLQNKHAYIFIALSALQFTLPLLLLIPHWLALALIHLILLTILAYALLQFSQQWLKSIFLEQRKTAYYAAGTLIYATFVSFVHLTWSSKIQLPQGYAGPFVMAVCGLLFYVDAQVKQFAEKRILLSRLSFFIYGLSLLAVLISYPHSLTLTITLSLGAILYAFIVWKYLTLIPLYLLLASLSGLYALLILKHFPETWHFMTSIPGFFGLFLLQKFAEKRKSQQLSKIICKILISVAAVLLVWSLAHAQPSFIAMISALSVTGVAIRSLYVSLACTLSKRFEPYKCYLVTGFSFVTLAYTPTLFSGLIWTHQFTIGLVLLVAIWIMRGLKAIKARRCRASVFLNSILLGLAFSIFLVAIGEPSLLPWHAVAVGVMLMWFSLGLKVRAAFYIALILIGIGGAVLKRQYFPHSLGIGMMFLALTIWMLLWSFLRQLRIRNYELRIGEQGSGIRNQESGIGEKESTRVDKVTLLGKSVSIYRSRLEMVIQPLKVALVVAWLGGLGRIVFNSIELFDHWDGKQSLLMLAIATGLGTLVTTLIAGQLRQLWLLPIAFVLSLSTLLMSAPTILIPNGLTVIPIYNLLFGAFSLFLLKYSTTWTTRLAWQGEYAQKGGVYLTERILHWTIFTTNIAIIGLAVSALIFGIFVNMKFNFIILALFFCLAGYRYQLRVHSYLLLFCIGAIGLITYVSYVDIYPLKLLEPKYNTLPLALVTVLSTIFAHLLFPYPKLRKLYSFPLYHISGISYVLALFGGLYLFDQGNVLIWVPWIFVLLALGHIVLSKLFVNEASLRGIGVVLLLTLSFISFSYSSLGNTMILEEILILWSFVLWIASHYILVPFNKRFPNWAITAHFWSEFGLVLVLLSFMSSVIDFIDFDFQKNIPWHILIATSLYLLLMLNDIKRAWLHWLTAFIVSISGVGILVEIFPFSNDDTIAYFTLSTVIWANFLLYIAPLWRHYAGKFLKSIFRLRGLDTPLLVFSTIILLIWLALIQLMLIDIAFSPNQNIGEFFWIRTVILSIALVISFNNVLSRHKTQLTGHFFIFSIFNLVLLVWNQYHIISLPMLLTVWTLALSFLFKSMQKTQTECRTRRFCILRKCKIWLPLSFIATVISLIVTHDSSVAESLLTLFFLSALSFIIGLQHKIWQWLVTSVILTIILLHVDSILLFPDSQIFSLLPFSTLQLVVLIWIIYSFRFIERFKSSPLLVGLSGVTVPFLANFIVLEWLLHGIHFLNCHISSWGIGTGVCIFNPLGSWAAIVAMLILMAFWFRYNSGALLIYGLAIMTTLLMGYARVFLVGIEPFTVWDTAVLITISYALFIIRKFIDSPHPAINRLAFLVPLLALMTIPFQFNSLHASSTLIAIATLYLLLQRESKQSLPLYFALLLFNISIYLWIPDLQREIGLIQIYAIPVALSVLIMLQLHSAELKPSVVNAVRLAALSTIYVSATVDAFLQYSNFGVFLLALGLSLVGVILGIALRIRAFLYTGTIFLVLYISIQLFQNFPEGRVVRAITLMILGGIITGGMIWFNLQREKLLQRWQMIRGDLATWE